MSKALDSVIDIIRSNEADLLADWLADLGSAGWGNDGRVSEADVQSQTQELLRLFTGTASAPPAISTPLAPRRCATS